MNVIYELKALLKRHAIDPRRTMRRRRQGEAPSPPKLLDQLTRLIWQQPSVPEDQLAKKVYGKGSDRKDIRFKKLKRRLIDRLGNEVLSIDLNSPAFSNLQRGFYSAHREYLIGIILGGRGSRSASLYFFRRALRKATKYEVTKVQYLALHALQEYYGMFAKKPAEFERYHQQLGLVKIRLRAEYDATEYYTRLVMMHDASPATREKIHLRGKAYLAALDGQYDPGEMGYRYAYIYYLIKLTSHYSISDHAGTLSAASEAIDFFSDKHYEAAVPLTAFLTHKLMVYVVTKEYGQATETFEAALGLVETGTTTWFKIQELGFLLMMHTGRYREAFDIYSRVAANQVYEQLPRRSRNKWLVNRAYLYYLDRLGMVNLTAQKDPLGTFRVGRFINSVPVLDKEKEGRNIPILIIQILFSILQQNDRESTDRIDTVEKYLTRYLRKPENYRSKCFIKILLLFAKVGYQKELAAQKTRVWYDKLENSPLELTNQSYEIEVVTYEKLYEAALSTMRK